MGQWNSWESQCSNDWTDECQDVEYDMWSDPSLKDLDLPDADCYVPISEQLEFC